MTETDTLNSDQPPAPKSNVCPACGAESPIVYRFCLKCGCRMPNARPIRPAATSRRRSNEVRRRRGRRSRTPLIPAGRRRRIVQASLAAVAVACALLIYTYLVEPNAVVRRDFDIAVENLPPQLDGFRIAQISDTHVARLGWRERRAISLANEAQPDVIVLTGDLAGDSHETRGQRSNDLTMEFVGRLRAKRAVYAALGTWDTDVLFRRLNKAKVPMLIGRSETIEVEGARIAFAGLTEESRSLAWALREVEPGATLVVLAADVSRVSTADAARAGAVLSLTGARHGGQVRIPLLRRIYWDGPEIGLRKVDGAMWHYASPGLGTAHTRARFLCPPEVSVFTLRRIPRDSTP